MCKKQLHRRPELESIDAYDYHDVITWIEQKHRINVRDFAGKFGLPPPDEFAGLFSLVDGEPPYLDFWRWLLDRQFGSVHNRSYHELRVRPDEGKEEEWARQPAYVNAILKLIADEYPEEESSLYVYVSW